MIIHLDGVVNTMMLLLILLLTSWTEAYSESEENTVAEWYNQTERNFKEHQISSRYTDLLPEQVNICENRTGAFKGNVVCTQNQLVTIVFIGHCISYIDRNTSLKLDLNDKEFEGYVLSRCPFFSGVSTNHLFVSMSSKEYTQSSFNDVFCRSPNLNSSNREGLLCGKCKKGHSISILSLRYNCLNCSNPKHSSKTINYLKAIGVTVVPITVLFLIVTIFHIGLTSAPTNGYLFFSHAVTIQINVLMMESGWANTVANKHWLAKLLSKILLAPHFIWTFDFANAFNISVSCLWDLDIMYILSLQYLYALYPMLLLLLALILIKLHGRNCKPVVFLWKPFCFLCVRLRRNWDVRTSLVDAFATFILLSYSKLIGVSMALINPNPVYSANGSTIYTTLHYDVNTIYLSKQHLPFFIIAILMLSTLGFLPPLLLILYPFRWFQKVLNILHLNRFQSLYTFVDAFQGCYKNGTRGSPERRYFAGFYFIFRIIVIANSFAYATLTTTAAVHVLTYTVFLLILAVLQPYKNNFFNILDAIILVILVITNSNILYILGYAKTFGTLPDGVWPFTYALLLLPAIYLTAYVLYWICTRFRARCCSRLRRTRFFKANEYRYEADIMRERSMSSPTHTYLESITESIPDRVTNPHRYMAGENSPLFKSSEQRTKAYGALTY